MTSETIVMNGVNVAALADTINAVKADRAIADFKFRVKNKWIVGGENRSTVDDYFGAKQEMHHAAAFELVNDEPPVLLSTDKGPNPVEYILHGLAGCLTTTLVYHAAAASRSRAFPRALRAISICTASSACRIRCGAASRRSV